MTTSLSFLLGSLTLLACARAPVDHHVAIDAAVAPMASATLLEDTYRDADVVLVGTLAHATVTALETDPPRYVHHVEVAVDERLFGAEVPQRFTTSLSSLVQDRPLPTGTPMVLALRRIDESTPTRNTTFVASRIEAATLELRAKLSSLPKTPAGLSLSVAQTPGAAGSPAPYGDGVFELTLRNDSANRLVVPGVLTKDAGDWIAAIEIRDEAGRSLHVRPAPADATRPLELAPHSELKVSVDVKPFGVMQRVGGGRLTYSFGLGPLRTSSFFYYVDAYHGRMLGASPPQPAKPPASR